jgi:hypothetical protein
MADLAGFVEPGSPREQVTREIAIWCDLVRGPPRGGPSFYRSHGDLVAIARVVVSAAGNEAKPDEVVSKVVADHAVPDRDQQSLSAITHSLPETERSLPGMNAILPTMYWSLTPMNTSLTRIERTLPAW